MRAVVDTNIVFSAFHRGGKPGEVMRRRRAGDFTLCLSQAVIDEYNRTLARPRFEKEFAELDRLINLRRHCVYRAFAPPLKVVKRDLSDDKFAECAVALNARFIVSGDGALADAGHDPRLQSRRIAVVNPADFLAALDGDAQ